MKKTALLSLILAGLVSSAYAQTNNNTVNFTINGRILAKTCQVTGGNDKTITMTDKDVGEFAGSNTEVFGDRTDFTTINCAATQTIRISYTDKATGAPTNQAYLRNTANGQGAEAPAGGVGVKVYFRENTTASGGFTMNTGQERDFRTGSGSDHQTMRNYQIHVHPYYFRTGTAAQVTPGKVTAQMTLNITYP